MVVYNYNEDGLFTGISEPDESPLEKGVYLIPARATEIEPPICIEGFIPVFNNNGWEIKDATLLNTSPIGDTPIENPQTQAQQLINENIDLKNQINKIKQAINFIATNY